MGKTVFGDQLTRPRGMLEVAAETPRREEACGQREVQVSRSSQLGLGGPGLISALPGTEEACAGRPPSI